MQEDKECLQFSIETVYKNMISLPIHHAFRCAQGTHYTKVQLWSMQSYTSQLQVKVRLTVVTTPTSSSEVLFLEVMGILQVDCDQSPWPPPKTAAQHPHDSPCWSILLQLSGGQGERERESGSERQEGNGERVVYRPREITLFPGSHCI